MGTALHYNAVLLPDLFSSLVRTNLDKFLVKLRNTSVSTKDNTRTMKETVQGLDNNLALVLQHVQTMANGGAGAPGGAAAGAPAAGANNPNNEMSASIATAALPFRTYESVQVAAVNNPQMVRVSLYYLLT